MNSRRNPAPTSIQRRGRYSAQTATQVTPSCPIERACSISPRCQWLHPDTDVSVAELTSRGQLARSRRIRFSGPQSRLRALFRAVARSRKPKIGDTPFNVSTVLAVSPALTSLRPERSDRSLLRGSGRLGCRCDVECACYACHSSSSCACECGRTAGSRKPWRFCPRKMAERGVFVNWSACRPNEKKMEGLA